MHSSERSSAQSYFWPVVLAVGLHVLLFAMLFVSFAFTPELPPARPIVQATLYELKSRSPATVQTNQKIAGEAQRADLERTLSRLTRWTEPLAAMGEDGASPALEAGP